MVKKLLWPLVKWIMDMVDVSVTYDNGEVNLIIEFGEKIVYSKIFKVKK